MKKLINYETALKYLLTGGLAFIVDYLLLTVGYYLLTFPLWVATSLGYFGGVVVSFSVNRIWVYGTSGRQRKMTRQLVEYALLLLINYIFTVFTIHWLNDVGVTPAISKIAITAIIAGWNYIIFSKIIFAHKVDGTSVSK